MEKNLEYVVKNTLQLIDTKDYMPLLMLLLGQPIETLTANYEILYAAFVFDLYTLLRMFKPMNNKQQKNIIVYAGALHIENIKSFLLSQNYKVVKNSKSKMVSRNNLYCIETKDIYL